MKKNIITTISTSVLLLPVMALAQMTPPGGNPSGVPTVSNIEQLVSNIENVAALVFGCIAVVMFIVAGVLFLTAQGQPEKVQSARSAFIWGVAGVVVGIIAYSIVAIVGSFLH